VKNHAEEFRLLVEESRRLVEETADREGSTYTSLVTVAAIEGCSCGCGRKGTVVLYTPRLVVLQEEADYQRLLGQLKNAARDLGWES
jgi:hypothetical protein